MGQRYGKEEKRCLNFSELLLAVLDETERYAYKKAVLLKLPAQVI